MELNKNNLPDQQEVYKRVKNDIYYFGLSTFRRYLPSSFDGLKPVHRRILYTLWDNKITNLIKVNKLSGMVISLHPHNDVSISEAIIKMAQDGVTVNHALLSPEGSFGNISDLSAASPRYISTKVSNFGNDVIISLIDSHTLEMIDAESDFGEKEPKYLPSKLPIVLINGILGIAESFTSNIPQHNLNDICDICIKYIKNKNISPKELSNNLFPDYVQGGTIVNGDEIPQNYYDVDYSSTIKIRGDSEIDLPNNQIIIRSLPFLDFDSFIGKVKSILNDKDSSGNPKNLILSSITYIGEKKDSDTSNPYVFIMCKNGTNLVEVLENLYKNTNLEYNDKVKLTFYHEDKVKICTIKDIVEDWYKVNYDNRQRKFIYQINNNENKIHILEGLLKIYPNIDEVIEIIKKSNDTKDNVVLKIKNKFKLSLIQARGIYEMQLGSLTKRSEKELENSINKIRETITNLSKDLNRIDEIMINDILEIKKKYGRPRKTKIIMKLKERTDIVVSNGAVLATRNSIGVFDSSNIISGKKILNGLKSVKIDNTWVKGIINSHKIDDTITSVLVFYSNGNMHTINPSILNSWIPNSYIEENGFIKAVCPIYKDIIGTIVCITSEGLLKRFETNTLSSRVSQSGAIIENCIFIPEKLNNSFILFINKNNEYLYIKISDIPIHGRTAQGVKTSFTNGDVKMTLVDDSINNFVTLMENTKLSEGYVFVRPIEEIKLGTRTTKLKKFHDFPDFICNGIGSINLDLKDQIGLFISDNGTSSLKLINLRNLKSPRKISCKAFDLITLSL